jgi:MFS family permease
MVIGCIYSTNFDTFTTFRSLQGLFGTIPQVIGLPIIFDMYHKEDWAKMINIWGTTFLVGPFLGPALAGYILDGTGAWQHAFKVLAGFYGLSTILLLIFGYESFHVKGHGTQQTSRVKAFFGIGNTGDISKIQTLKEQTVHCITYIFKVPMLLVGIATLVNFTWPIGITVTISTMLHMPPYLFNTVQDSSVRWAPILGALTGWLIGYIFNKWIYAKKRETWRPEYRLHGVWVPIAFMALGLVTYGCVMHYGKHWIGLCIGWYMVVIGMVATTV